MTVKKQKHSCTACLSDSRYLKIFERQTLTL